MDENSLKLSVKGRRLNWVGTTKSIESLNCDTIAPFFAFALFGLNWKKYYIRTLTQI